MDSTYSSYFTWCSICSLSLRLCHAIPRKLNIRHQRISPPLYYVFTNGVIASIILNPSCITGMNFMGENFVTHNLHKENNDQIERIKAYSEERPSYLLKRLMKSFNTQPYKVFHKVDRQKKSTPTLSLHLKLRHIY